tara:strand:- start:218 stop:685 length:468 start_codon:yes stop_codon:yes gene_type:complete
MIIEVKQWPESQEVMENSNWFFIMAPRTDAESDPIGDSSYARILDESEYILVENIKDKYTFSEYVNLFNNDGEQPPVITGDKDTDSLLEDERMSNESLDVEPTTADEYNKEWLNEDKYDEIKELITDLEWETDRMSSSGRETLDALWKIFKIEGN